MAVISNEIKALIFSLSTRNSNTATAEIMIKKRNDVDIQSLFTDGWLKLELTPLNTN
jgi:hypothetical protein